MYNISYQFLASTFARTTYEFVEDTDKNISEKESEQIKTWLTDKSFNRYTGGVARNCLHGYGTYDWKYDSKKVSYSGTFYINNINGYGQFSYVDGSVYEGLMKYNMRYGPGVLTQCDGLHNVGFWKGKQLLRLLQRISSCVPHLASSIEAKLYLLRYRRLVRVQEDVPDPAKELMSEIEVDRKILKHSMLLYLPSVRQPQSLFINQPHFHKIFCNATGDSNMFIEVEHNEDNSATQENQIGMKTCKKLVAVTHIVAWNNNKVQIHMLKHIFKHRNSEATVSFNVLSLLHCKRKLFREEGYHESLCIQLINACMNGERKKVQEILTNGSVNPNVSDCNGNSGLMIAASQDAFLTIETLLNGGADVNCFNDEGFTPFSLCLMRYLAVLYNVKNWESAFLPPIIKMEASYTDAGLKWRHKELIETQGGKGISVKESTRARGEDDHYIFGLGQKPQQQDSKSKKAQKKLKVKPEKSICPSIILEDAEVLLERQQKLSIIKKTISKLIRKGANPNLCEVPLPPLLVSIFTKDVEIVNMVLNTGADPNVLDSSTGTELTPLHVTASHEPCNEMVLICNTLLDHNANANIMTEVVNNDVMNNDLPSGGKMPLHVLCMHEDFSPENCEYLNKMATMLIRQGNTDVDALFLGHTPLSWCIVRGNAELLRSLLESNRVDPNKIISEEIGIPLTVLLSEKLTAHLDIETRLNMCEILLEHGADPLKHIEVNGFDGNIMEFAASQFETKEKMPKKGKKDEDKKADKMKQFMSILSKAAQSHITRHLRGKIVNDFLQSIKNNVTPEISTMEVEAITLSPENVMDCLRHIGKKTDVYAEDAIKLLKMVQNEDEDDAEVLQLVHNNLGIIPYKKKPIARRTRVMRTQKTYREREQPVMGKLPAEEISPIKYPFPRLMSTADLIGPIILPPDTDIEREIDSDGILSFFHPKTHLKPFHDDIDDDVTSRNKAISKVQQDLMRKQALIVSRRTLHGVHGKKNIKKHQKNGELQVVPEVDMDNGKYEVCFECGSKKDKMLFPCMRCRSIKFCSEKCYTASMGKQTHHQCTLLPFTEVEQILEANKRALLGQEWEKSGTETDKPEDRKKVNEKEDMVLLGTESSHESNDEIVPTKSKKMKSDENEKLFDGKKNKEKGQKEGEVLTDAQVKKKKQKEKEELTEAQAKKKIHKEKEDLTYAQVAPQTQGKQASKMTKVSATADKETAKGKFVNGTLDSSVNKKEEDSVKRLVQSGSEDYQLRNKGMPSVAIVLNFGADSETSFDGLPLPYVILRDGCLYYRLYGSKPQILENYSLL